MIKPICVFCGEDITPEHMCFKARLFWKLLKEEVRRMFSRMEEKFPEEIGEMPTDIELFDMKERGVLEAMTVEELKQEVKRGEAMSAAVATYQNILLDIMQEKNA